jgi:hypothetical protein
MEATTKCTAITSRVRSTRPSPSSGPFVIVHGDTAIVCLALLALGLLLCHDIVAGMFTGSAAHDCGFHTLWLIDCTVLLDLCAFNVALDWALLCSNESKSNDFGGATGP